MKTPTLKLMTGIALSVAALAIQQARADMITYDLTGPNGDLASVSGTTGAEPNGYGTVTVTITGANTATVVFSSTVSANNYINLFGDGSTADLNVNATSFSVNSVTGGNSGTGFSPATYTPTIAANQNVDGLGGFNLTITSNDGFHTSSSTVTVMLTDNSGNWANAASVLFANGNGNDVGAHVFITTDPANAGNTAIKTGYAGNGVDTDTNVPDGGYTAIMLGAALLGLAKGRALFGRV